MGGYTELDPERLAEIARIEAHVSAIPDVSHAIELLVQQLAHVLDADGVLVDLVQDGQAVTCFATPSLASELGCSRSVDRSVAGACLRAKAALKSPNIHLDPRVTVAPDEAAVGVAMICVPIHLRGPAIGVVRVVSSKESFFTEESLAIARFLTGTISRILLNEMRSELSSGSVGSSALELVPIEDFEDRRTAQVHHAQRYGYPVTVVSCRLKGYVTKDVLQRMSSLVRNTDELFRLDADEFAILMPGTSASDARTAANRLERAIQGEAGSESNVKLEWRVAGVTSHPAGAMTA